ncbi:MAG: threonine-phosphate decarboxylase CobD [Leptolyngbyaceae cyanobacterium bins.59]|nr:threonine-phosphate decarboxylase CobD [Leptolyngbyaceae cyanobacterium bins.59]
MARPIHGGNLRWAADLVGCSPDDILDFSASINPLGPPPSAIDAIQSALASLRHYPDPDYWELRQAIAEIHSLAPDWILPGNGAAELLTWAARDLAQWETVGVLTPGFADYFRALRSAKANPTALSLTLTESLLPLSTEMGEFFLSIARSASSALLLNNPHNPTGSLFLRETLQPYLEQFALVVVDEAFMDFLPPDRQQSLIPFVTEFPNLVVLRSLTKFYSLPGLRLGYAVAHPDRLRTWQQQRDPWPVNTLAAAAALAVLADTAFQQKTWDWLRKASPELQTGLAALPGLYPHPGAANYLLVRSEKSVVSLQKDLLQSHRILIRDCLSFPELGDRFFRVAIRTSLENQQLMTALQNSLGEVAYGS